MKEFFVDHNFRAASLDRIDECHVIIREAQADGLTLSLRQLYYQLVARASIENSLRSYKNLGNLVSNAREAGLISWTAIEDRNRGSRVVEGYEEALDVLDGLEHSIIIDPWTDQDVYCEVWIEKDALTGTIDRTCNRFRVPYMACKGYLSASEAWRAGHRFRRAMDAGKDARIIHLGDHDPSGLDMTRDNQQRASMFADRFASVEIKRIALNMDQIEQYNPPPNPAKMTDARAEEYVAEFGESSWELDALKPRVIADLVQDAIEDCITDRDAWQDVATREEGQKHYLRQIHDRWDDVMELLDS